MTGQLDGLDEQLERIQELPFDPIGDREDVEEEELRRQGCGYLEVIVAQLRQQCVQSACRHPNRDSLLLSGRHDACATAAAPLSRNGSQGAIQDALEGWTTGATAQQAHIDAFLAMLVQTVSEH